MAGGGSVKDDDVELESLDGLDQLGESHGLVYAGHTRQQFGNEGVGALV